MKWVVENIMHYLLLILIISGFLFILIGFERLNIKITLFGLFILSPFGLYFLVSHYKEKQYAKANKIKFEKWKSNAKKVIVNLDIIKIKTNKWSENKISKYSLDRGFDQVLGLSNKNIKTVYYNKQHLTIRINHNEKIYHCDTIIDMPLDILKMKITLRKQTILYINPNNFKEYFLDLDFLYI